VDKGVKGEARREEIKPYQSQNEILTED